jgi:hypothetical protein
MSVVKCRNNLGIGYCQVIHDKIRCQRASQLPVISYVEMALGFYFVTLFAQLNCQGSFVDFSSRPGFKVFKTFIAAPIIDSLNSL